MRRPKSRNVFTSADYRRIWSCGLFSGIARWLEFIALGIFAYEVTKSPPLVALLALVRLSPFVLLGFFIGALTDVVDRKKWLLRLTALLFAVSLVMAIGAGLGYATYGLITAATLFSGIYWVTDMPLRRRLMMEMVDSSALASASAFDNFTNYLTRALGPVVGGVAYQYLGVTGIFGLSAVLYVFCFLLILGVGRRSRSSSQNTSPPTKQFTLGMLLPPKALLMRPQFLIILGVTIVYNMWCFPLVAMIPVIADRDLSLSPALVGLLSASEGIGGAVAAITIGFLATNRALFALYYWGPFGYLILLGGLALSLNLATTTIVFVIAGAAAACFSAAQYTLVYLTSPEEMRGRATGILSIFIGTSALGIYNAGYLFDNFTSPAALWIMAGARTDGHDVSRWPALVCC